MKGDYPQSMRLRLKDRLPTFTQGETTLIKGSYDFLGLNYYTAAYAIDDSSAHVVYPSWRTDSGVNTSSMAFILYHSKSYPFSKTIL